MVFHQDGLLCGLSSGWSSLWPFIKVVSWWSFIRVICQWSFIRMVSQWYFIRMVISVVFHQGHRHGHFSSLSQWYFIKVVSGGLRVVSHQGFHPHVTGAVGCVTVGFVVTGVGEEEEGEQLREDGVDISTDQLTTAAVSQLLSSPVTISMESPLSTAQTTINLGKSLHNTAPFTVCLCISPNDAAPFTVCLSLSPNDIAPFTICYVCHQTTLPHSPSTCVCHQMMLPHSPSA